MKFTLSFALAVLLSSCFGPNTTIGGRQSTSADGFAPYGNTNDSGPGIFSNGAAQDPNAAFVKRTHARYGPLFMAETKPWMVGSVQEQWPSKYALPGSGWKGRAPQTPVIDDYSMGNGGRATGTK